MRSLQVFLLVICLGSGSFQIRGDDIDFNRDIRPILSDHCFQCHGPDAKQRKGDFRLDTKDGMFRDLGGYFAFAANDPKESEAIIRIFSSDDEDLMPPAGSKLQLSQRQKTLLKEWVQQGAQWSEHWSFAAPVEPVPPRVKNDAWPASDLDRFVLARLESKNLQPSKPACREKLIRRVTLDLTGIPPTLNEIDDFVNDQSPQAYEKIVDRLLASPRYGERMAWEWLDAARYADTDGFQADPTRDMWPWRDWLINALNENKPYDQFTIEMLAGDLLPNATKNQIIATGFNRNHMYNGEGGRIPEETRIENVFDRVETTSTVWLGLTMTCARCHDHKFDPVSQREYYELFAFFNDTSESGRGGSGKAAPTVKHLPPEQELKLGRLEKQFAEVSLALRAPDKELDLQQQHWEQTLRPKLQEIQELKSKVVEGRWMSLGTFPPPDGDATKSFEHEHGPESRFNLRNSYADASIVWQPAKLNDGRVNRLPDTVGTNYLYRKLTTTHEKSVTISLGSDDSIQVWLNGELVLANNVARGVAADQESIELNLLKGDNDLLIKIVNTGGAAGFYYRKKSESVLGLPENVAEAVLVKPDQRTNEQRQLLQQHYRSIYSTAWKTGKSKLEEIESEKQALNKSAATVMVMDSLPSDSKRKTHILGRGAYDKPLELVSIGTPAFLPTSNVPQRNRLDLANWIVHKENPLTARVTVNRYWQVFFGTGLVKTSEDFGLQGTLPSHPLLLDWLACKFVESGWDVKALHKMIVMSSTYRQTSSDNRRDGSSYRHDPDNELYSRGPRFRMPSWMLRDQALSLSGLLVERIGGRPVNPYQPAGMWAEATFGKIKFSQGRGEDLYRRSIYTFWRRIIGPPVFFDNGKRQTCVVKPSRTNSPLHALTTLNETAFVESARNMAQQVMKLETKGTEKIVEHRIKYVFRAAAARQPTRDELDLLSNRWSKAYAEFSNEKDEAEKLLSVGESPRDNSLDTAEHAAFTVICSLILNLDEVLTKE